ncbi:hypothetical protein EXIGLDRAFT_726431 [Exidia glandulosa HHB12029]|uniref:Uncharacterized protein n=1 Tax=Exidia glandulosa HHB12029 TaxID=1314781 RepID=A0A165DPT9_EXIGL|nr:hypothetical protein EXIGLDRAFT_726431 [Exidia glandulosa HHB12029]
MYAVADAPAASFLFTPSENTFFTSGDNCATRQALPSPVHVESKAHSSIDTRRSSYASSQSDIPSPTHSTVPNISVYATRVSAAARSSAIRSPWLA